MTEPLTHVLVMLEDGAVSFCHYENPLFYSSSKPRWMADDLLRSIVRYAERSEIALTFLLGKTRAPLRIERLMNRIPHSKIVPMALRNAYPEAIFVLDSEDGAVSNQLDLDFSRNVILRLSRRDIGRCSEFCTTLAGRCGRLSVHMRDIEYFTRSDLAVYADELSNLALAMRKLYVGGHRVEINVLTDRMMLHEMRNCDAGVTHVSVAPNGECHICPAFVNNWPPIGRFDGVSGLLVQRIAGIEYERAPLCTRCDAFHCKRCVYLNRTLTEEFNVPSEQQCALAHIEREASRLLLKALGSVEPFRRMPRIAELNYRDPIELLNPPPDSWGDDRGYSVIARET